MWVFWTLQMWSNPVDQILLPKWIISCTFPNSKQTNRTVWHYYWRIPPLRVTGNKQVVPELPPDSSCFCQSTIDLFPGSSATFQFHAAVLTDVSDNQQQIKLSAAQFDTVPLSLHCLVLLQLTSQTFKLFCSLPPDYSPSWFTLLPRGFPPRVNKTSLQTAFYFPF